MMKPNLNTLNFLSEDITSRKRKGKSALKGVCVYVTVKNHSVTITRKKSSLGRTSKIKSFFSN